MSRTELTRCSFCFSIFESRIDDLGTYRCQRCNPERCKRLEEMDPKDLSALMLKIYRDAKQRLDTFKKNQETNKT